MNEYTLFRSPVGRLTIIASDTSIRGVLWEADTDGVRVRIGPVRRANKSLILIEAASQLKEYFAGRRKEFQLPTELGGTEFQRRVWRQLRSIPYGETRSYGEIANRIGNSKASRAVGGASNRNPISIIVPCHRVLGANGALTGFAAGLGAKEALLALEARFLLGRG